MLLEVGLIIFVIVLGFIFLYISLSAKLSKPQTDETLTRWLQSLQNSLNHQNQNLNNTLRQSYQDLHTRLEKATTIIGDLKKEAGEFSTVSRSIRDLQVFLSSPKIRGGIGEQILNDLIGQVFPKNSFFIQHAFKSGQIVDVAIQTDAGLIPIDSKFPLGNFQKLIQVEESDKDHFRKEFIKDVKKHLKDISSKYILPSEGTVDFALMYLPSESVYYEVVNLPELLEYARDLRVYPVSPTTLYAHLQTIMLSFEGKKIESKTKEIFSLLRSVQKDQEKLETNLSLVNKHLTNALNQTGETLGTIKSLGQKLNLVKTLESKNETDG